MSIQKPVPVTQAIFDAAQKEDRHLTKREIEQFCLMPMCGPRYSVIEVKFMDDWLRRGGSLGALQSIQPPE